MRVILNVLGAPADDLMKLKRWADDWIALISVQMAAEQQAETVARLLESQQYWTELIEQRAVRPRNDLVTALVAAAREEETPISLYQMINACSVIALAGHETTTNLLGNCLYRLLSMPEQWDLVCSDHANVPKAIEETLRADTVRRGREKGKAQGRRRAS